MILSPRLLQWQHRNTHPNNKIHSQKNCFLSLHFTLSIFKLLLLTVSQLWLHPLCLFFLSKYPLAAIVVILIAKRLLDKTACSSKARGNDIMHCWNYWHAPSQCGCISTGAVYTFLISQGSCSFDKCLLTTQRSLDGNKLLEDFQRSVLYNRNIALSGSKSQNPTNVTQGPIVQHQQCWMHKAETQKLGAGETQLYIT